MTGKVFSTVTATVSAPSPPILRSSSCPWQMPGCLIAGPFGTGEPEISDDCIAFNGLRYCGHEKIDGPLVVYPTDVNCGIDSEGSELFRAAFLAFTTTRRCDGQCCMRVPYF